MGNSINGGEFETVIQGHTVNLVNSRRHPTPSGLPARSLFVGRSELLAEITAASGTCLLAGLGGIGKTALAVEAAYRLREQFPGGTLFVDLHGYDNARLTPEQALDTLLPALTDLPAPPGLGAKQQLYRSLLATREPALIVADNAATPDQVTPLLPNDPRHRLLITSRHLLTDRTLTPRHFPVDVLPESVALLTELAGPSDRHPALAELCGHLPLALRIAGALLTERSPEELVDDLTNTQERLTELDYGPDLAVRATFDLSHRQLTDPEARLFALLGRNPGPDIGLPAAAALADLPERETTRLLRTLTRAHLVTTEHKRYQLHDLVRLYAAELPCEEGGLDRLIDHYRELRTTGAEHPNLLAVAEAALATGRHLDAAYLAHTVVQEGLLHRRLNPAAEQLFNAVSEALGIPTDTAAPTFIPYKEALAAARTPEEQRAANELGLEVLRMEYGRSQDYSDGYRRVVLFHIALVLGWLERFDESRATLEECLTLSLEFDDAFHQGQVLLLLERPEEALAAFERADATAEAAELRAHLYGP
ncbi:tetratricopeptide (TPR) repeat protein [Kitasatospora gansuensis]|uniref:Tetratricopeptide (TPR) repeat protein n=1 Tax=Kitasatospora gansuensis TaxID=258050 RepID=A0A7W7SBI3_9ACTN|nr:hypothetical protein [Kitasatospora gansuensis]MBB4946361.1 tetratricopeptide (TPR) repeat protein [Kitasatospora gansuensis]